MQLDYLSAGLAEHAYDSCQAKVGPLLDALDELHSRLGVGLNFASYGGYVGDARVAYDQIDVGSLTAECLTAAETAKRSLNAYVLANTMWNGCIGNLLSCDFDLKKLDLQTKWLQASTKLALAKTALQEVKKGGGWRTETPLRAVNVSDSIYRAAVEELCGEKAPTDAAEPCSALKETLVNGVEESELDEADDAVKGINTEYRFTPEGSS